MEISNLSSKLRQVAERELGNNETIRWIEQPIPRLFSRSTVSICLTLLVPLFVFSTAYLTQGRRDLEAGASLSEALHQAATIPSLIGVFIAFALLILIFTIPVLSWLEARQTVYVITDRRALILWLGKTTKVTSFSPSRLRVILRREHRNGSGDVIAYVYQARDSDGDVNTQAMEFKQIRNPKAFEKMLLQPEHI